MTDGHPNAESGVVHELAGLLSSIWSLAEIVERRPEHEDREAFISLLRQESRRAARTMKDWQLLRALEVGHIAETVAPVWLHELMVPEAERSYDLGDGVAEVPPVKADAILLSDLLERCGEVTADLRGSKATLLVGEGGAGVLIAFPAGESSPEELRDGLARGEGRTRALYLTDRVLNRWGGRVRVAEGTDGAYVILELATFTT